VERDPASRHPHPAGNNLRNSQNSPSFKDKAFAEFSLGE
jgi:hypothetical protein